MAPNKKDPSKTTEPKGKEPKDTCFTIMPFGGWFDRYYSEIYSPAIRESGLFPIRADDLYLPSPIVSDIWAYTRKAKVILADLTEKNPNVFYELGLAHAITKPAILVAESMNDIPFDLRALRIILYEKNGPSWGEDLKQKIVLAIKEVLKSPLEAILPTFVEVKPEGKSQKLSEAEKDILEIKNEITLMRRELSGDNRSKAYDIRPREVKFSEESDLKKAREIARSHTLSGMSENNIVSKLLELGFSPRIATAAVRN